MALKSKIKKEEFEKLSPELQKEAYTEKDGVYILDVTSVDGLQLANVEKLQTALQSERDLKDTLEKKLKVFDGLEPEKARDALKRLQELDSGDLPEVQKKKLETLQKQLQEKFDGLQKQLEEKHGNERKKLETDLQTTSEQLNDVLVTSAIKSAIATHKGSEKLLLPVVRAHVRTVTKDGKRSVEVIGKDNLGRLSKKADSGQDPMSIEEFVSEMKNDQEFSRAFEGSGASGSGAGGDGTGTGSGKGSFISEADARDPTKYRAAKAEADKAGRPLEIR